MHPTQLEVLESLRQGTSRQFNELLLDAAETSDNLTYHLKRLQSAGFIESPVKGEYVLAKKGLIYLNNNLELNHDLFPTVSCMLELHEADGMILVMEKRKQPYLGSLHLPTFGVTSSLPLREQIDAFLQRYQITANGLRFKGVHRERVRSDGNLMTFDKFFVVFRGTFTAFRQDVADRRFLMVAGDQLTDSPNVLSASKTVLAADDLSGFTETTQHDTTQH